MAALDGLPFAHVVVADFEFEFGGHASFADAARSGERPRPVCMVAKELRSGRVWRLWRDEFGPQPPFPIGPDTVFIAYYASAEIGCFRALGWQPPTYVLDLFTEFRARTNGYSLPHGASLLGALTYFSLDGIDVTEKRELRALILTGGPWSADDREKILAYCESDIVALERLLPAMLPRLDLPHAILRGRFMRAAAAVEWNGTPIDTEALARLRRHWTGIQDALIRAIDKDFDVFDGRSFRLERWERWLVANNIPWPLLDSGRLDLSDDTFREMARVYPAVAPMRELRSALSEMRLNDLAVGRDARNRTLLSAFRARSSRCAPSNTRFIFGPSVWLRGLIQPPPGHAVAYLDWCQQEFGIAAVLSQDAAMQDAYLSGDPYLTFAKQAGAVPPDATKRSHTAERELFKTCALGVQYGMEERTMAQRIGQPPIVARDLLRAHRETYRAFWKWSDAAVDAAVLNGSICTVFGWPIRIGDNPNPRALRNFPCQANGAEMLRLACCFAVERGIEVCAPVHDAMLICAPLDQIAEDATCMRACMSKASQVVLNGFELRSDMSIVKHPDRYSDQRGAVMWARVHELLAAQEREQVA